MRKGSCAAYLLLMITFMPNQAQAGRDKKPSGQEMKLLSESMSEEEELFVRHDLKRERLPKINIFLQGASDYVKEILTPKLLTGNLFVLTQAEKTYVMEHFEALTELNWITALDLSHATHHVDITKLNAFQHLEKLSLKSNKMERIPPIVYQLSRLKYLNVSHNQIKRLHPNLKNLIFLETLLLDHNKIACFPHYLCRIHNLRKLTFDHNPGLDSVEGLGKEGLKMLMAHISMFQAPPSEIDDENGDCDDGDYFFLLESEEMCSIV